MNVEEFIVNNKEYREDFTTRSTYHSNAIEGNPLAYVETYAILYNDNNFKIRITEPQYIYEVINYKKALELVFNHLQYNKGIDEKFIQELNQTINRDIKNTSGYRTVPVSILGNGYVPPTPKKIPYLMSILIDTYNNNAKDIFEKVAKYHIEFEKIHPFEDGNGRTGRLLINYELIKNNLPPIVILKDDNKKYYEFLQNEDYKHFAIWIKELSKVENDRMRKFGYTNI